MIEIVWGPSVPHDAPLVAYWVEVTLDPPRPLAISSSCGAARSSELPCGAARSLTTIMTRGLHYDSSGGGTSPPSLPLAVALPLRRISPLPPGSFLPVNAPPLPAVVPRARTMDWRSRASPPLIQLASAAACIQPVPRAAYTSSAPAHLLALRHPVYPHRANQLHAGLFQPVQLHRVHQPRAGSLLSLPSLVHLLPPPCYAPLLLPWPHRLPPPPPPLKFFCSSMFLTIAMTSVGLPPLPWARSAQA